MIGNMLPKLSVTVGLAKAETLGDRLVISTGQIERVWQWTGYGFATISLKNVLTGKQWGAPSHSHLCDWDLPNTASVSQEARLVSLSATTGNDDGFTTPHLCITGVIEYPRVGLVIDYLVWAYPGSAGLRTQLRVRALPAYKPQKPTQSTGIPSDDWLVHTVPETPKTAIKTGFRSQQIMKPNKPEKPFEVMVDLRREHLLTGMGIVPINNTRSPGLIRNCQVFVADDGINWSAPIYEGDINPTQMRGTSFEAYVHFPVAAKARFVRMVIPYTTAPCCPDWGVAATELRLYSNDYPQAAPVELRSETIHGDFCGCTTVAVGYYGGTQTRNGAETPIVEEHSCTLPVDDLANAWANVFCLETNQEGLMLVKESHKMANQPGHDTGRFIASPEGIASTGWGLLPTEISADCSRDCWANWVLVYSGGEDERQLAIKQYDRIRYPLDPAVDLFCQANTWSESGPGHEQNAAEAEVLKELPSVADLGLDLLVIDHGWQNARGAKPFTPEDGWKPHPDMYPEGWKNVVAASNELGVKLGLWAVAQSISLEELKSNYDQLQFISCKLDFAELNNHDEIKELMYIVREFIKYTNFKSRICWDTTEVAPRYGYYFAREYGYLHVMNRKPTKPVSVTYIPWVILRDHWQLAQYTNTNQYQMICQNINIVNREVSDAYLHNHPYALAITLMGLPEFLQSTWAYSEQARTQLRPLVSLWKLHREDMLNLFVFPIGDEPSNASWTGFQFYAPGKQVGYLLIFRELYAAHATHTMALRFLHNCELTLTDLCADTTETVRLPDNGCVCFNIDQPAGFKFIRYEVK